MKITKRGGKGSPITAEEHDETLETLSGGVIQVTSHLSTTKGSQILNRSDVLLHDLQKEIIPKGNNSSFLIFVRWFGECQDSWNVCFNLHANGERVNNNNSMIESSGLSTPASNFFNDDNGTSPEIVNFQTHFKSNSVAGEAINFQLKVRHHIDNLFRIQTNTTFVENATGAEKGTSEIIIMEIGEQV